MRVLSFVSGLAVLLTTLAFGHLIHHFVMHAHEAAAIGPGVWAGVLLALCVWFLSFVGGCLLLWRAR